MTMGGQFYFTIYRRLFSIRENSFLCW